MSADTLCDARWLPSVGAILRHPDVQDCSALWGTDLVCSEIRAILAELRSQLLQRQSGKTPESLREELLAEVLNRLRVSLRSREQSELGSVLNATGVLLHTSLGRATLAWSGVAGCCDITGQKKDTEEKGVGRLISVPPAP